MNSCIYVFSGTGTSLAIAKKIGDSLGNTEIKLIPGIIQNAASNEIKAETTTVGFVFPNYFGSAPDMVLRFIRVINLDKANYIFSIVTSGGGGGHCLRHVEQELRRKGKKLNYGKCVTGTPNYIVASYYNKICKTGRQRTIALNELEEKSKFFAGNIACKVNEIEASQHLSYIISWITSPKSITKDTRPWDKEFCITPNCIGCGLCKKVCQADNIEMINGKPDFQHNCQRCMACIQYCPQNAIGFKGKELKKPRYFHPDYPAGVQ